MKKIIWVLVLAVLLVIGIGAYYLFFQNNSGEIMPTASSSATPTPAVSAIVSTTPTNESITVEIKNFSYNPSPLNIKTGTKVTWINKDNAPHTITSVSGNLLNSPTLSKEQSFSFTFTNPGTINYYCTFHPMMKGSVDITN